MKTYYFLATVANATSQNVRTLTASDRANEAFASAAIALSNRGFVVTAMQQLTADQYFAPNVAPMSYDVEICPVIADCPVEPFTSAVSVAIDRL